MVRQPHRLNGHGLVKLQEIAKERKAQSAAVRGSQTVRHDLMTEQQKWQWDFGRVAA